MTSGDVMIEIQDCHISYETKKQIANRPKPQILEHGHHYYCTICSRAYRRKQSKYSYASCGHALFAQRGISEGEYKLLKRTQ